MKALYDEREAYFFVVNVFEYEIVDQTTTRNRYSSENQIKTRYYVCCYFYLLNQIFAHLTLKLTFRP